jgi:hypothetical protein
MFQAKKEPRHRPELPLFAAIAPQIQGRTQFGTAFSIEEGATMTSRLKFLVPAAACVALSAVAFANVARAEDAPAKPDAMSADHMSGAI